MAPEVPVEDGTMPTTSFLNAIYAFAAPWLPLAYRCRGMEQSHSWCESMTLSFWRQARHDMLRVINTHCYRSVIALLLFSFTTTPIGLSSDEEVTGLSGDACLQLALQMLHTLRIQPRTHQFSFSDAPSEDTMRGVIPNKELPERAFMDAENCAYWAGLINDTVSSVTLDRRATFCSGLLGIDADANFQLIRKRSLLFRADADQYLQGRFTLSDDEAMTIASAAGLWKLFAYKRIAVFKEALRDGYDEERVNGAFKEVVAAMDHFEVVYHPVLNAVQPKLQYLSRRTRFEYCR